MDLVQVKANTVGKGAIRVTIPKGLRDGLDITTGTVLNVSRVKNKIIFEVDNGTEKM